MAVFERVFHAAELAARADQPLLGVCVRDLLRSVLCRTSVCRIQTRWSPARAQGFMSALMQLVTAGTQDQSMFDNRIAISPEVETAADGSRAVEVYVRIADNAR